jgi:GT2 family glycosyltransferase
MKGKSKIAVSLVFHNEARYLPRLAKALKAQTIEPFGIYITDNNSSDDSVRTAKELFPNAKMILSGDNPGFGPAHNKNMKLAFGDSADAVFVLNTDTEPDKECLSELNSFIVKHPDTGIIAPLILYGNDTGKTTVIQNFRTNADLKKGKIKNIDEGKDLNRASLPETENVNYFSGTACVISRNTYDTIGGFTEDNFLYGEEMDYSCRAHLNGVTITALKAAKVWHFHDWSEKNIDGLCREYYYINLNRIRYFKKYGLKKGLYSFIANEVFAAPLRIRWTLKKGGRKFTGCFYSGIINGLKNKRNFK